MYKLAVLDIDGTLVNDKGTVSKKTVETIKKVKQNGGIVTICTGRNIRKTLPVVKAAGIDVPFVCMDGTVMYDPVENKVLEEFQLSREEACTIVEFARDKNAMIEFTDGDKYYKYIKSKELNKYDMYNGHDMIGKIKSYLGGIRYIKNLADMDKIDTFYQFLIASDENTVGEICKNINSSGMERVEVRDTLWRGYLFVNRKGIKKSNGVKMLCKHFNISMNEVVTMGDERNDIDMIEMAGMGVAMGNAVKSVKKVADDITLKNTEDGVAAALEKYFF